MTMVNRIGAAGIAAILTAGAAHAVTFDGTYTVGGDALSDPGLVVEIAPNPGTFSIDLDVGDSTTFELFTIWTDEDSLTLFEDTDEQDIFVAFDFTAPPPPFSGGVSGETDGKFFGDLLVFSEGQVTWNGPEIISFGALGDGEIKLELSDASFNLGPFLGFGSLTPGEAFGAKVELTATYVTAPSIVPLPASALLLLAGLGGLGAMRKFRKS